MQRITNKLDIFTRSLGIASEASGPFVDCHSYSEFFDQFWATRPQPFSFTELELLDRGQSKEVRKLTDRYVAIKYIPSLSSHTNSRFGMIPGTERLRCLMTAELFTHLELSGVNTLFVAKYDDCLVFERVDGPQLLEVIFKYYHTGTPLWRYYGMSGAHARDGSQIAADAPYPNAPLIRFDWRNPANREVAIPRSSVGLVSQLLSSVGHIEERANVTYIKVRQDQEPAYKQLLKEHRDVLGEDLFRTLNEKHYMHDEVLPDDLAALFMDVPKAKGLARTTVGIVQDLLSQCGYQLWDGCINITANGDALFGELSFDCLRIRKADGDNAGESYDKDLWRKGYDDSTILARFSSLVTDVQRALDGPTGHGKRSRSHGRAAVG